MIKPYDKFYKDCKQNSIMNNLKFLEKLRDVVDAGIEVEKKGISSDNGINNLYKMLKKRLGDETIDDYNKTISQALIRSDEWQAWENYQEKIRENQIAENKGVLEGVFDFDETRETGYMSSEHMQAFLRFVSGAEL